MLLRSWTRSPGTINRGIHRPIWMMLVDTDVGHSVQVHLSSKVPPCPEAGSRYIRTPTEGVGRDDRTQRGGHRICQRGKDSESTRNSLTGNTAGGNAYGFYLDYPGNPLTSNAADSNTQVGYDDASTGSGTAGTGKTSFPRRGQQQRCWRLDSEWALHSTALRPFGKW
jgi:parallel beta-helix repeat protein